MESRKTPSTRPIVDAVVHDLRWNWKQLAITAILYKLIALVLLTPLVSILFQGFLSISGRAVLADEDILSFFLTPLGWICLVVVGAVATGILGLEQTALMVILVGSRREQPLSLIRGLRFTVTKALPVLSLTGRIMARALLILSPFLAATGGIYLLLLGQHDINYYLTHQPSEFWAAIGLLGVLGLGLIAVTVQVTAVWLFTLPLLIFEAVPAREVLRASRQRTRGIRWTIAMWVCVWGLAGFLLFGAAGATVNWIGRTALSGAGGSLPFLLFKVGSVLALWSALNLGIVLVSAVAFAALLLNLYRGLGAEEFDLSAVARTDSADAGLPFRLSKRNVLATIMISTVLAATVGIVVFSGVRVEDRTEITAHRGASKDAPENTMAAVLRAIEDGADWVEIDVQETADGEVVLMHDSDFKRVAGSPLKIWDAAMDDLENLDVGSWFGSEFKNERVATLDQVLETCKNRIGVNIELKHYGHAQDLEERTIERVERNGMQDQIVIMSLLPGSVKKVKTLRPDWKVGLLTGIAFGNLMRAEADFLAVHYRLATRNFIRRADASGKEVHAWTVNDPIVMSTMMGRGVDNLITDKPALARAVLNQRAELNPIERLIIEVALFFKAAPEAHLTVEDF